MATLLLKLNQTTCSTIKVEHTQPDFNPLNDYMIMAESDLSKLLLPFDHKDVHIKFKVFNSVDEIKNKIESAKSHNKSLKLKELKGCLRIEHQQRSTDLDDWFETSAKLDVFEYSNKGNRKSYFNSDSFDIYEYLANKSGKILLMQITHI